MRLILSLLGLLISASAAATPVFISPGQCIMVGSQQVCAMKVEGSSPGSKDSKRIIHICRYGDFKDSEVPDLKSYALIEIIVMDDGKKVETSIRNFGSNGKEACEQEASKMTADKK